MKKVLLIGDSIRMGYGKYVREALEGTAEVYYPLDNCRFSTNVFRFLPDWKFSEKWPNDIDLVHWNAGLWDVLEIDGEGPLNTPDTYEMNIGRIYRKIKSMYPNAIQIFATSPNVVEEGYKGSFKRHNHYIKQYNEIALRVLGEYKVPINDLYELTTDIPEECRSDMTHFNTPQGTKLLGDKVVNVICKHLNIETDSCEMVEFCPEKFSEKQIGF